MKVGIIEMTKTKLIIAVAATLLMLGTVCSSSDDKKDDAIPVVIYLKNESKERPKEKVAVYLNKTKIFEGEVPYTGDMGLVG